jgi:FkbM family methyltransferase
VRDEGAYIETLLRRVIKPDSNCIDVGCHLGSVLERMKRYAPQGRHVGFEPVPHKARWLMRKYPDIDVRQEALSDAAGEVEFFYQKGHSGFSGLQSHKASSWQTDTFRVRCSRLDDIVSPTRRIDFIKIDVEGAEHLVLRGAARVLRDSRPYVLFECTHSGLALFDVPPETAHMFLERLEYEIYLVRGWLENDRPLSTAQFLRAMNHPAQAFNFFASPIGRQHQ